MAQLFAMPTFDRRAIFPGLSYVIAVVMNDPAPFAADVK